MIRTTQFRLTLLILATFMLLGLVAVLMDTLGRGVAAVAFGFLGLLLAWVALRA